MSVKLDYTLDTTVLKQIKKNISRLNDSHLEWGWVDRHAKYSAGDRTRGGSFKKGQDKRSGIHIAKLAFWNEYGTKRVGFNGATIDQVPRPYFKQSLTIMQKNSSGYIENLFHAALLGQEIDDAVKLLGTFAEETVKTSVAMQNQAKLKPSTVSGKGHSYQWVETKAMMDNVSHRFVRTRVKKSK